MKSRLILNLVLRVTVVWICTGAAIWPTATAHAQRQMEKLGRGVVALRTGTSTAYIGWRLLATDPRLALRRNAWFSVPDQLDGSGAMATRLVDELFAMIDDAAAPLRDRQATEVEVLEERVAQLGERGSGRKALEEVHKRELRRQRVDELRFGLLVLARHYRDELAVSSRPAPLVEALGAIQATSEALVRNPNEPLQFQALFLRLGQAA